jgi:signal transduction histidine kinase
VNDPTGFRPGLRLKLAAGVLAAVVISMTVLAVMLLSAARAELTDHLLNRAAMLSRSVERVLTFEGALSPAGADPEAVQRTLLLFSEEEGLLGIGLFDGQGKAVTARGRLFELPPEGWRAFGPADEHRPAGRLDGETLLLFRHRLGGSGTDLRIGSLWSLGGIERALSLTRTTTVLQVTLSSLLVLTVLFVILTMTVVRPLGRLAAGLGRVAAGDLEATVRISSRDEFGWLAASFNAMTGALRKSRRETAEAQGRLITAEKMASLGTLAAGVAHEVGNPLAAVVGYIDLLRKGGLTDRERAESLERSASELNRIHRIMRELLDYARPTAEPRSSLDLNDILRRLTASLGREKLTGGMKIDLDLTEGLPRPEGSPHKMEQVFTNLVLNAVWATGGKGTLTVRTSFDSGAQEGPGQVVITFADDGRGISPDDLSSIFDPFFTTRLGQGGTGLGLSISRRIVEEAGGIITAESPAGGPTVFTIRLPLLSSTTGGTLG